MPELLNKKDWKSKGFVPKAGERPREIRPLGRYCEEHLYGEDQVRPVRAVAKRAAAPPPITTDNVLRACWTVNRAAKRYRDAAASCYGYGCHSFAGSNKSKKENCYDAKDKALRWLISNGHVRSLGLHGVLTVWTGGGYTFHSLLGPEGAAQIPEADAAVFVEAKPKCAAEMRLIDANALIASLPECDIDDCIERCFPIRVRDTWREDDEFDNNFDEHDD